MARPKPILTIARKPRGLSGQPKQYDTATTESGGEHHIEHFSDSCGEPGETYTAGMSHIGDMGTAHPCRI